MRYTEDSAVGTCGDRSVGRDAYISNHNCKLSVRQSGTKCAVVQVYLCSGVIIAAKMTAEITKVHKSLLPTNSCRAHAALQLL